MRCVLVIIGTVMFVLTGCAPLSETRCLASPNHTLVVADKYPGYTCEVARNECEKGFVQAEHGAKFCEANSKCEFIPANCYCPEEFQCICGGGPPSSCQLKP